MLAWVCSLIYCFSSWRSLTYWNQVGGDWKRVSCHGNKMFYSLRCVFYRTITLPSFNDLCYKLAKIAHLHKWCNVGLSVWHHQSSHLHNLPIFQTWISPELMQVFANGKQCFHSFIDFYAIHLKNQEVKFDHSSTLSFFSSQKEGELLEGFCQSC